MRKLLVLFLSVLLIFIMATNVFAYNTFNQHKLIYGVGNYGYNTQYYWIDSSASEYTTTINTAMNEWKYTSGYWGITTPIWYNSTTVKSNSRMEIYQVPTVNQWWGKTEWYWGSSQVDPSNSNWVWGKVLLDGEFGNLSGTSENNRRKAVIAHEMGHVMGLAHTSFHVLMHADVAFMTPGIYRAQPNDLAGINYLY